MADQNNAGNLRNQENLNEAYKAGRETLQSISSELGRQRSITSQAAAEYAKMDSILKKLQDRQGDISNLSSKEIENLKKKYQLSLDENKALADKLAKDKNLHNLSAQQIEFKLRSNKLSEKEKELLQAKLDGFKIEQELLDKINEDLATRVGYETKVNELTGATGAILSSMKGSMNALGLASMSNYLNVDAAKQAMEDEADAIARGEKEGGKLSVRMAGIKTLTEGFTKSLFSAEAVIGFIVQQLAAGSQNMADFRKQTGMSYESAYAMNMEMKGIAAASGDNFITSEKLNKSFAMMTEHLGVSADILGGKALVSATNLTERLGMSADNAAQLTTYTRLQGKDTEAILTNTVATVGAFNKQNKTAINVKEVMNDVAGASKATYLNMGKNVEAMAGAATKARALGLSLAQVEKISESMLNFEESIGNELQANLLLGGGVNLAKAREAALTGDMAKLTEEIGKQEGIKNAFATKNVIAQQAAADALGISKEELAQMTLQQDLNNLSAKEFKDRYGEATYESMKSRSASEKLGDAMDKVKDILGSIIQVFTPFLDLLASILSVPLVPWILAAVVAARVLGGAVSGVGKAFGTMFNLGKQALTGIAGLFKQGGLKAAIGGLKDKLTGGFASAGADKAKGAVSDKAGDLAQDAKAKVAGKEGGTGFKDSMKNLAEGLKEMGAKGVIQGIINLALAGPALVLALPSIPFLLFMGKVDLKTLPANFKALAEGLSSMKDTFIGSAALAAFGIAGTIAIPSLIFLGGVAVIGAAAKVGLEMLAAGLKALGKGAAEILIGIAVLGAFNVAMIPFAYAMGLAAPYVEAFGVVITSVFTGLATLVGAVADGFVKLMEAVSMEKILPMMLLGPALFGIAAGLMAIGGAGIMAIPGIAGLTALAVISPALVSLADAFGMGGESAGEAKGKSEEGSMAAVEAKLTELIAVVKAGGNVYLDTNKVGRAQVLGSYKSS